MTYIGDETWAGLASDATAISAACREAVLHGKEAYEAFIRFRSGRTDQQVADALSALPGAALVTLAQVQDLAAAHQAALELYNFVNNVPGPVQGDRMFAWRKFV